MKPILTIQKSDICEYDLLFYRPSSFFGLIIKIFDSLRYGRFDIAFSHVAIVLRDDEWVLRRYDAMEGYRTGYRETFDNCYVFSLPLSDKEKRGIKKHCLSRKWSKYDRRGIFSFFTSINEDEFRDYCSELVKNSLLKTVYWNILWKEEKISPLRLWVLLRKHLTFKGLFLG